MSNEMKSIFDNGEFVRNFVEHQTSVEFEKYTKRYLNELLDTYRTKLEKAEDVKPLQAKIELLRMILNKADVLRAQLAKPISSAMVAGE
jgi:uncharacterized protein YeaO (DUF488 family)